jgi:mRNA-degrading endonuclease toxin of MazEF toxin-antitoxin module
MADFGPGGPRPVIVVSREELNRGRYALAVVCTSARFAVRSKLSNCPPFHLALGIVRSLEPARIGQQPAFAGRLGEPHE